MPEKGSLITTSCLACKRQFTESSSWLKKRLKGEKMICPECGGELDKLPLVAAAKAVLEAMQKGIEKKFSP